MLNCIRTNSDNKDFQKLVSSLDAELASLDGEDHFFYAQFNKIQLIKHAIVAYENEEAVGCGALKEFSADAVEVKRMYVIPQNRGKGIAALILAELETWAKELGFSKCVLETGHRMPDAIALYKKSGYTNIENYGQYIGVENSVCFEKLL